MGLDISTVIGTHVWQNVTVGTQSFCVPDLNWCARFILLCVIIRYFIGCIFKITHLFK